MEALRAGDEAGAERQLRAQREFLCDHLLNWIDRFPADVRKAAEKKFQEINAAKETIYKARGL